MRILVTGGSGFIGSYVAERASAAGHSVRVLDNLDPQVHPNGVGRRISADVEFIEGDVRDGALCARALAEVDCVVHCAGAVGVGQSMYRVEHYIDVNVRGTAALLDGIIANRANGADGANRAPSSRRAHSPSLPRLVVLTSMTGYAEGCYRRPSDGEQVRVEVRTEEDIRTLGWEPVCPHTHEPLVPVPTPETAALLSRNVYALSKRYQEELALTLGDVYGFPVVCLRLFNVYGPGQSLSNPYTGVIAIFLSRLLAGQSPMVYEDGRQSRDFISVHDVADTVVGLLESSAADGEVVNIGSGIPRAIGDIAVTLARLIGREHVVPEITERFRRGDVRHCLADVTRAREWLAFEPKVTWEEGLAEVVAWATSARADDHSAQAERELRDHQLLSDDRIRPEARRE
ncbi:MAG: nucleoside-diphosphate-sugar epimerase [Acidobacteria bacterium]|jgi:dTDP-L-rhamnose 4-epimerase|nr:nucleoside-diphosphate-sugar epimerase [Acidobacteriota bacterium]MDP7479765.1 NAD-dependent epimerase/dehydratase family protein [Vicinamibacterales bacterium]MDP7690429.1 NAD-dependent epimerase/dehydratase family protein [Vicinamibacterales bacterium]HJN42703.1 NAD-dependent epimerase/dehydratase family protein [Vicinamibacterales bacterium]